MKLIHYKCGHGTGNSTSQTQRLKDGIQNQPLLSIFLQHIQNMCNQ